MWCFGVDREHGQRHECDQEYEEECVDDIEAGSPRRIHHGVHFGRLVLLARRYYIQQSVLFLLQIEQRLICVIGGHHSKQLPLLLIGERLLGLEVNKRQLVRVGYQIQLIGAVFGGQHNRQLLYIKWKLNKRFIFK